MRTELKSHSSSNVPVSKTPALVRCCRCLPVWLYGICKCSLAKESFEKNPAVSDGCCLIAQSVKSRCNQQNWMYREGLFTYFFLIFNFVSV